MATDEPLITQRHVVTTITSVFVLDPNLRGRYIKTDRSVIEVACPYCKAAVDEPCHNMRSVRRYSSNTHSARRYAAILRRNREKRG